MLLQNVRVAVAAPSEAAVAQPPTPAVIRRPDETPHAPTHVPAHVTGVPSAPHGVAPTPPATVRRMSALDLPPLHLSDDEIDWKYIGPQRYVVANIASPQHIAELTEKIPITAEDLFESWAEPADVHWELMFHLERQGIGPEHPGFLAAYRAAFQQRVAQNRRSSRMAKGHAVYQRGAPDVLYRRFVTEVVPALYAQMNAIYAGRVTELSEKYDLPLARQDAAYKVLVGHLVFRSTDDDRLAGLATDAGLSIPADMRADAVRDAERLSGNLASGLRSFRASFETGIYEARNRDTAEAFGRAFRETGIKPPGVRLAIVPEYR